MTISFYSFLFLTIALSMDTFAAAFSYRAGNVKIPFLSMLTISFVSGAMLTLSLQAGQFLSCFIPPRLTKILSFFILLFLSLYKLYDSLPSRQKAPRSFTTDSISEKVNKKDIHVLSFGESLLLSLILSLDSISAGLSTGIPTLKPAAVFLLTSAIHFSAVSLGLLSGKLLLLKTSYNFTWLSAIPLLLLAFLRLF